MVKRSIYLAALAVMAPYLYDRYLVLAPMLAHAPGKFEDVNLFEAHQVKFGDRLRNCEDVLFEEGMGVAFLSCNPGRDRWNTVMGTFAQPVVKRDDQDSAHIWIYDYSTPDVPDSDAIKPIVLEDYPNVDDFQPLGIDFDAATSTLYVINHSRNSGNIIEVFQVSVQDAVAKHMVTLKHPLLETPNSIHSLGDGKMLITNDHYIGSLKSRILSQIETYSGIPGGSVVYTDIHNPSHTKKLTHVPFANGITMINSTTVAIASSSKSGVYFYTFKPDTTTLEFIKYIRVPFAVDNLSVDGAGKLLMAGHPFAPGLTVVSRRRAKCDMQGSEEERKACECTAPSWVAEWTEEEGLKTMYKNSGKEFCSSSTFARDASKNIGVVTGLYEKGLLVVKS